MLLLSGRQGVILRLPPVEYLDQCPKYATRGIVHVSNTVFGCRMYFFRDEGLLEPPGMILLSANELVACISGASSHWILEIVAEQFYCPYPASFETAE